MKIWVRLQSNMILKNLTAASGGTVVFFITSFVRNLVIARFLGPVDFAAWNFSFVLLQYTQWSHFSILNAFRLDGALSRGAGDVEKLHKLRRLSWSACVFPAIVVTLISILAALWADDLEMRNAIFAAAAMLLPLQLYTFTKSYLSTEEKFTVLAKLQSVYAVLNMLLTLICTYLWGFWGALTAQVASYLMVLIIYRSQFPLVLKPLLDWDLLREQFWIGLPLGLNGLIYSAFITIDRTLVVYGLGLAALGQYGLTSLARSSLGLIPSAISEVIYMRASTRYGETRQVDVILPMLLKVDRFLALFSAPVLGLCSLWTPWAINLFLPEYALGIPALQIFLLSLFFFFPVYAGVLLTVIGKARELTVIYAIVTGLQAGFVWTGLQLYGINGAALGTMGGGIALFLLVNIWGLRRVGRPANIIVQHLFHCALPFLILMASLGAGWWARDLQGPVHWIPYGALAASFILLILYSPLLVWRVRRLAPDLLKQGIAG